MAESKSGEGYLQNGAVTSFHTKNQESYQRIQGSHQMDSGAK